MTAQAKKPASATASKPADTPAETPAKTRQALSTEKRLAIAAAAVLTLIATKGISKGDTSDPVKQLQTMADEINNKTIGPVTERIAALQKEIAEFTAKAENFTSVAGVQKLKDLTNELAQKQKRLKTLNEQATGS